VLSMFTAKYGYIDQVKVEEVGRFEKFVHRYFAENAQDIIDELEDKKDISPELEQRMKDTMQAALEQFDPLLGVK